MRLTATQLATAMLVAALVSLWVPFSLPLLLPAVLLPGLVWRWSRIWAFRGWVLIFCIVWATWRMQPPGRDLSHTLPQRAHALDLRFEVVGDAVAGERDTRVPARIRAVQYTPEWDAVTARAQLRLSGPIPAGLTPGTHWQAHGRVEPGSAVYTGLRRAEWIIEAGSSDLRSLSETRRFSVARGFFRAREHLSRRLSHATLADTEAGEVLQALLLARRGEVDDEWMRKFARTGHIHLFAISGLHLTILTGILLKICQWTGIPYRWRGLMILPVLFAFTACTGFRAGTLRALIMTLCLITAPVVYRRPNPHVAFMLAVVIILGAAPEQLLDVGFQYSFLLVGGLIWFAGAFDARLTEWLRGDPWAPPDAQWPWWKRRLAQPFLGLCMVNTLCFVISAPLTAQTFHLFSPIALVGNLVAVPLAFLLLAFGFPLLPTLLLTDGVAALALAPARIFARLMLDWVGWMDAIPGGVWWVGGLEFWQMLLFYGLPVLAIVRPVTRKLCWAVALVAIGFSGARFAQNLSRTELVAVHADRGQASWIRNGPRGALLIDAGSGWSGWEVRRQLQEHGVNRIPAVFLTHPSRSHVEGLSQIRQTHEPLNVYVAEPDLHHPAYRGLDPIPLSAGDRFSLAGWEVEVLWPPAGYRARAAGDRSLVLRFSDGFASVLFMGGANERVETALLERGQAPKNAMEKRRQAPKNGPDFEAEFGTGLSARLLMAGNYTRIPGCVPEFLAAVLPEAVVFSGEGFRGITEARELSESRASRAGLPVWRVPENVPLRMDVREGTVLR
ncbi:MAG: ComEC/Rec2 family competence protein [Verrucomicrobia bacterium]|nr:ComEC/Rec2 family competence protein [Verrucomicrobiota bacterium]MCH8513773.1 ComEC/Rec2 family competence protein [Kiritimatiellia bacterium]